MAGVTTEGIILKRKNFGEADRMITILTERLGKISVVARGVRRITSRRAGNVEVLNRVKLQLFKAKGYTLIEAESIETFTKLKENLVLSTVAFHIIELVDRLLMEDQENPQIFAITLGALKQMEENPRQIILRAFEVKIMSLLGFFSPSGLKEIDPPIKELLTTLQYKSYGEINNLELKQQQALALENILRYYIEQILEAKLKSLDVLNKLKV